MPTTASRMQDLMGVDFATFGTTTTFSWLDPDARGIVPPASGQPA
ncbi:MULTISPECIES: hypothetical protein [unclassified Streptomyces]